MTRRRILILGAGLAGLSAAWHLKKLNRNYQLFEKEPEAGGLCRSKKKDGFIFDYSGHLLHFKHRYTFNLLNNLLEDNLLRHQRNAWVYSWRRYSRYPFQANLYGLPSHIIKECLSDYIKAGKEKFSRNKPPATFSDWIVRTFGKGIARYFMVPYNKKFWTISPKKLTYDWVNSFIPIPSMEEIIDRAAHDNPRNIGYNAYFWYPKKGGINQLILAILEKVRNIHTNSPVTEIDISKKYIKINGGAKERFDLLISTIPLPELSSLIKNLPSQIKLLFDKLRWNSILNLNFGIDRYDYANRHWVYFPQKKICFFRVGFPHNFSSDLVPNNKSSLYAEVSYSQDKPLDKKRIISQVRSDLNKVGILNGTHCITYQDVNDIKYGYPIYDLNYAVAKKGIFRYLIQNNILPCGRYGAWSYMSMEDAILNAKNIVENLI